MNAEQLIPSLRASVRRALLAGRSQAIARRAGLEWLLARVLTPVIAPALAGIREATEFLKPVVQRMESRFLECGAALERLSGSGDELVSSSQELVRAATSREEAERSIDGTMEVLAEPLKYLDRYGTQLLEHSAALEEASLLLGRLMGCEAQLKAAVAPLRVTQTMFRVEAARLPQAEQGAFLTLCGQIETLRNQVSESFGAEFARLLEVRSGMNQLLRRVKEGSERQSQVLARERERIGEELEKLNRQIEMNSGREIQLTARSQFVHAAVSRVVMALQSQDIVAQQAEHLFEGIERIHLLGRELQDGSQGDLGEKLARLQALVKIQAGQVAGPLRHLQETAEEVESATGQILGRVNSLDDECIFLNDFSEVTASAQGTIQVLLDIIDKIRDMVGSAVRLGMDSLEQLRPVNAVTTQLGDCVEEFAHQMNLVALNAQIQAVQIGEGTGLEVLAAHTALIAKETSRVGAAIREDFDRLRTFLNTEVAAMSELAEMGRIQQAVMESEGRSQETLLHAVRDAILVQFHRISEDTTAVQESAERVQQSAMLLPEEEQGFRAMEAALSSLADSLSDALTHSRQQADSEMHEAHYATYTMASERENHRKALGGVESGEENGAEHQVELF